MWCLKGINTLPIVTLVLSTNGVMILKILIFVLFFSKLITAARKVLYIKHKEGFPIFCQFSFSMNTLIIYKHECPKRFCYDIDSVKFSELSNIWVITKKKNQIFTFQGVNTIYWFLKEKAISKTELSDIVFKFSVM